ncbi:flagellar hook-basal body complex protein FliE [Tissierella praeacuta]|uniref:flagellar hook-basal body complex protein FliE n=1 Tax=Tissierella praeacuta TaxID=43131 RepID=UPI00333F2BB0
MNINKIDNYKNFVDFGNKTAEKKNENNFGNLLTNALDQVNEMQLETEEYKKLLAVGELDNLHDLTIAAEKADTALQVVMSIRGKVVEAYREIMRIQI